MKYIIGVDGGGTKTEAVAYDFQGKYYSYFCKRIRKFAK